MRVGAAAALVDGRVLTGDLDVDPATGRVSAVGLTDGSGSGLAVPGLVDLQVNGIGAVDLRSCDPDGYHTASTLLLAGGATAVQPTFYSQSLEAYQRSLGVLAEVRRDPLPGCRFLPAHLEGPFLSPQWAGAHEPEHLVEPDPAVLDLLLRAGPVGFVTLAPELPGAVTLIERLVDRGVTVSVGHTDADARTMDAAIAAGARHLTHCWNAHRRLSARDPGPAGVALGSPRVTIGLIGDLQHVAAEVVGLTLRAAPGRVAITTDAVAVGAGTAGRVDAGGVARRSDGTIAGGVARPDDCLRNLVDLGVELPAAVEACGGAQRRLLGLPEVRLRPGDPADVVVLDDALQPVRTLVGAVECWHG